MYTIYFKRGNVRLPPTLSVQNKSEPWKREIHFFRYWNTIPRAQKFKLRFEFQTSLTQNSPVGTLELLPFGANLDIPWYWILPEIILRDSSLFTPVGVYQAYPFLRKYLYLLALNHWELLFIFISYSLLIYYNLKSILIYFCIHQYDKSRFIDQKLSILLTTSGSNVSKKPFF